MSSVGGIGSSGVGSSDGGRGAERRPPPPVNVTEQGIQNKPGGPGSFGSTGEVRGTSDPIAYTIERGNLKTVGVEFNARRGTIDFQVGEGAGGETSASAQTPNPPYPNDANRAALKSTRIDMSA